MSADTLRTVPARVGVRCSLRFPAVHLCPFKDETDQGELLVNWRTGRHGTLEIHALRVYLNSFASRRISHEDLVARIADSLRRAGMKAVVVTWIGQTGGAAVRVTAG